MFIVVPYIAIGACVVFKINYKIMVKRINNILNSLVSEIAMLIVVCCMVVISVSFKTHGLWTDTAVVSTVIGGIVLLAWMVWAAVVVAFRKNVRKMPLRSHIVLESASRILFLYWLYITGAPVIALILVPFIVWDGVRSVKQAFNAS